ncbi:protein-glutamate methylesterase/protein-glutamine glutaminase [Actinophytocola xanthii]|uniref:Protein-glutamate methylesterase/protein-glutamine glutaminase n=1 Tax=Actinophytocola xanthii TaxID=1912961 RepID=A0A1Q8BXT0_9PSEU|nr:chemotaxis response regulator protein-glutamate methylesterase [Actinophytocola xanthii]OLF06892.1 chemotaxis response regulator protein-glutamate methylesterase [Actinophytocola xanthii]
MISVLVVDDSAVIRRLVTDVLSADPGIRVIGTAPNGKIALDKIDQLNPDLVTLDVEMPVMDGVTAMKAIRKMRPRLPVVMFSTLTSVGADATLAALAAGASDYVTKPANVGSLTQAVASVREQLLPRIHALCARRAATAPPPRPASRQRKLPGTDKIKAVAIASSTGGPEALRVVLTSLPAGLQVPFFVVQHMPPVFTQMLAQRINTESKLTVTEAKDGELAQPGHVYLAPGDFHMEVARVATSVRTKLHAGPKENHCRPAADVLFRSVANVYGGSVLVVVLTGMGQDGKHGCEPLVAAGARVIAQDENTSVVWGMPGAVAQAGLADAVLPLEKIADSIATQVTGRGLAPAMEVSSWN